MTNVLCEFCCAQITKLDFPGYGIDAVWYDQGLLFRGICFSSPTRLHVPVMETTMDDLLDALKKEDSTLVCDLASKLLVTREKQLNRAQANEFERYAPCKIYPITGDAYHFRTFVGYIEYNKVTYSFG